MSDSSLCVVLHDVADATLGACERLIRAIDEVAPIPLTLLAVPRYHHDEPSPQLERWIGERSRGGDEIALHGWTHVDEGVPRNRIDSLRRRHYTRSEGEFWDLDAGEASRRLTAGIDWFERNGWPLRGFVAPAWLLGPGAWQALGKTNFAYTSTLRHIHLLPHGGSITGQSVVYSTSSAWRRQSSALWAGLVAMGLRANPVLRLELHPRDADHPIVRRSWQRLLERQLGGRVAMTVAQIAERWQRTHRPAAAHPAGAGAVRAD